MDGNQMHQDGEEGYLAPSGDTMEEADEPASLDAQWLRRLCLDHGADDVGFVDPRDPNLGWLGKEVMDEYPFAQAVIVLAFRLNKSQIRTPNRTLSSSEFIEAGHDVKQFSRKLLSELSRKGVWTVCDTGLFPMDMERVPKIWSMSLKPLAEAAGLGVMGRHRMVLHPQYGVYMYLSGLVIDRAVTEYGKPLAESPCLECGLCSSVCPTGAISKDGVFNFSSCITHNYREKLGGFTDWVFKVVESESVKDYRKKVTGSETLSVWQSLGYEANTKCDYCVAVCPSGSDVVGQFKASKKEYVNRFVRPLRQNDEKVYVVPSSDADDHVRRNFPHKHPRLVGNGLIPERIEAFIDALPNVFQRHQSEGLAARYHFVFRGAEAAEITVDIRDKRITLERGLVGEADIRIDADARTWLSFLAKESNIVWAIMRRKVRVKGPLKYLLAFGRCFPS